MDTEENLLESAIEATKDNTLWSSIEEVEQVINENLQTREHTNEER